MSIELHKVISQTSFGTVNAWENRGFARAITMGIVSRVLSAALFVFQILLIISFPARLAVKAIVISIEDKRRKLLQERSPWVEAWSVYDWNQNGKGLGLSGGSMFTPEILYKDKIHIEVYAEAIRGTFATTRIPEEELEKYQRTCVSVGLSADLKKFESTVLDIWKNKSLTANWQSDRGQTDIVQSLHSSLSEASIKELEAARNELTEKERSVVNQRISKQVSEITSKGMHASAEEQTRYIALRELRLEDMAANNKENAEQLQSDDEEDDDLGEHELSENERADKIREEENLMRLIDDLDPAPLPPINADPIFRPEPPPDDIDIAPHSLRLAQPGRRPVLTEAQLQALSATDAEYERILKITSMDPSEAVPKTLGEENKIFYDKMKICLQNARKQMEISKKLHSFYIGKASSPQWKFNLVQTDSNTPGILEPGTEIKPKTLVITLNNLESFIDIGPQKVTKTIPGIGNMPSRTVTFEDVNRGTLKRIDGNTESFIDYSTGEVTVVTKQPSESRAHVSLTHYPYFSSESIQTCGEDVMIGIWRVGIFNYFSPNNSGPDPLPLFSMDILNQLEKQLLKEMNVFAVLDAPATQSLYNKIVCKESIPDDDPIRLKLRTSNPFVYSKIEKYNETIKNMIEPNHVVTQQQKLSKLILELKGYNNKSLESLMLLMLAKGKNSYIESELKTLDASAPSGQQKRPPSAILNDIFKTVGDICTTFEKTIFANKASGIDWKEIFK